MGAWGNRRARTGGTQTGTRSHSPSRILLVNLARENNDNWKVISCFLLRTGIQLDVNHKMWDQIPSSSHRLVLIYCENKYVERHQITMNIHRKSSECWDRDHASHLQSSSNCITSPKAVEIPLGSSTIRTSSSESARESRTLTLTGDVYGTSNSW